MVTPAPVSPLGGGAWHALLPDSIQVGVEEGEGVKERPWKSVCCCGSFMGSIHTDSTTQPAVFLLVEWWESWWVGNQEEVMPQDARNRGHSGPW